MNTKTFNAVQVEYLDAFKAKYPNHKVSIERAPKRRGTREEQCYIVIDGDRGQMALTRDELAEATRGFTSWTNTIPVHNRYKLENIARMV